MDAILPTVVAIDRGWRRFVGFVAGRAATAPVAEERRPQSARSSQPASPPSASASPPRPAGGRRFRTQPPVPRRGAATGPDDPAPSAAVPAADPAPTAAAELPLAVESATPRPAVVGDAAARPAAEPASAAELAAHLDARRAQAAGLRALLLSRQRRYAEAESAFAQAAGLDPTLDLAQLDGFWALERGAHQAAVRAYEGVGRHRDAMALRATLDGRYRPRLVRTA